MKWILFFVLVLMNSIFSQRLLDNYYYAESTVDDRSNVTNIMLNSGAKNTTDFIQTANAGDPDGFSINSTFSVVTVGTNRWLRLDRLGSPNSYAGIQGGTGFGVGFPTDNGEMFLAGHTYNVRIKLISNGAHLRIIACGNSAIELPIINELTIYEFEITAVTNENMLFSFNGEGDDSKYIEIDYIEVWE